MCTIQMDNKKIYAGNLILVNAMYPMLAKQVENKITIDRVELEKKTGQMLMHVFNEINANEDIVTVSGLRGYIEQDRIYRDSIAKRGSKFTKKYVALPGHSEHQTGLAIDLGLNADEVDFISPEFPYDGICQQFREKAVQYGFVERYPKGKEKVTGIGHEPWHFRYVGYPHSEIMSEKNMTLEEYIKYIKTFSYDNQYEYCGKNGIKTNIYYVGKSRADNTEIELGNAKVYQISGNNVDGFIVTIFEEK